MQPVLHATYVQAVTNLVTHFVRTGVMSTPVSYPSGGCVPKPSAKEIQGMENATLGLMVLFLASAMVLTKDAWR